MSRRLLILPGLALALVATVLGTAFSTGSAVAQQTADSGKLRIVLDCDSSPERTTLTNRSNGDLKIKSIASLDDQENAEPYRVNETLKKGQSITLRSGEDAGGGGLTQNELYTDASNSDGARVRTSDGTFKERC